MNTNRVVIADGHPPSNPRYEAALNTLLDIILTKAQRKGKPAALRLARLGETNLDILFMAARAADGEDCESGASDTSIQTVIPPVTEIRGQK